MLFTSPEFLLLTGVTLLLYYSVCRSRLQQVLLLILSSLVFYGASSWQLTILLLASASTTTWTSYKVMHAEQPGAARRYAAIGVVLNLATLAVFKYAGLLGTSLESLAGLQRSGIEWLLLIPLPVGISFYTFQGVSMMVDCYRSKKRGEVAPGLGGNETLPIYFTHGLFFITFFPQLVAGPVVKAKDFLPQIRQVGMREVNWGRAFEILILGYFLKMVVANNLHNQTFWIQYPYYIGMSAERGWTLLIAYSVQIFSDFAGYSLIAIGIASLFGYRLPQNFNFPYIAVSIADFWRRWHISLSSWLRDYLYFPLGGNRRGRLRTYFNLLLVMALGGLWHGAAWSYFVWGCYHGLLLGIERLAKDIWPSLKIPSALRPVQIAVVFLLVTLGWTFFKLPNFSEAAQFINLLFTNWSFGIGQKKEFLVVWMYVAPVVIYYLCHLTGIGRRMPRLRACAFGLMLFLILVNSGSSEAFIYFQF